MTTATKARQARYATFATIAGQAHAAGMAAGLAHKPAAMIVAQHEDPFDDASGVVQSWYVGEGVCGFAWVALVKGNDSFARWAKQHARFRKGYDSVQRWVSEFGQSYERKIAYAHAYAEVLRENGIQAFANGRLD